MDRLNELAPSVEVILFSELYFKATSKRDVVKLLFHDDSIGFFKLGIFLLPHLRNIDFESFFFIKFNINLIVALKQNLAFRKYLNAIKR